jgi:phage terminase large subunit
MCVHHTVQQMVRRVGQYWHIFPHYSQARRSAWEGIRKDGVKFMDAFPASLIKRKLDQEMKIELVNGSIWQLVGSDKVDTLIGAGVAGIVFSEYAVCKPSAWHYLSPILKESGGWVVFNSTPRGHNHFHELYKTAEERSWFTQTLKHTDTKVLSPTVMEDEIADGMPPETARQEYDCDWEAAPSGAIWADLLMQTKVEEFEPEAGEIFTSWDLGHADATAIWFWMVRHGGGLDVLDYYENTRKPLSHYFDEVDRRPYSYRYHFLPHDARANTLQSSLSIMEQCVEHFTSAMVDITPNLSVADGIQAARWVLQRPIRFHKNAKNGLHVLQSYRYDYNEERKVYSNKPFHDWASHGSDAFRYLSVKARTMMDRSKRMQAAVLASEQKVRTAHYGFTMDELWQHCVPTKNRRM